MLKKTNLAVALFVYIIAMAVTGAESSTATGPLPWGQFAYGETGSFATGCMACSPSDGGNSFFLGTPPWTVTGSGFLIVQDAFLIGDRLRIFDNGLPIGDTSVPNGIGACGNNPVACFGNANVSSGIFALGPGNHSFTIQAIASPFGGGAAYLCFDTGSNECGVPISEFDLLLRNSVAVFPGGPGGTWPQFRDQYQLIDRYPDIFINNIPNFLADGIGATFIPNFGLTQSAAANILEFDHFNWLQLFQETPPTGGPANFTQAIIDPPFNCYEALEDFTGNPCPNRDSRLWYLDEQFSIEGIRIYDNSDIRVNPGFTRLEEWTDTSTLLFSDSPGVNGNFLTCLVGVRPDRIGILFSSPGSCFTWSHLEGTGNGTEEIGPRSGTISFRSFVEPEALLNEMLPALAKEGIRITTPAGLITPVQLDVEPRDLLNRIQPGSKGVTTVAILTTDIFDATSVDPLTVKFGPNEVREVHARGHIDDVNGDRKRDLVLHFDTKAAGIQCGNTSVLITGQTYDGEEIRGYDRIRTVGCK